MEITSCHNLAMIFSLCYVEVERCFQRDNIADRVHSVLLVLLAICIISKGKIISKVNRNIRALVFKSCKEVCRAECYKNFSSLQKLCLKWQYVDTTVWLFFNTYFQFLELKHLVHNSGHFVYFISLRPLEKSLSYFSSTL